MTLSGSSRARRILGGWSANTMVLLLAMTQQIVLIPLFLKFWSSDTLSAWLTIFAAGNLVLAADAGLHAWSLNRFFSFKAHDDGDRRTNRYHAAVLRLFVSYTILLALVLLIACILVPPSRLLGFPAEKHFDLAFVIMTAGSIFSLLGNLPAALYRARGLYGRIVQLQVVGTAAGQIGQVAGVVVTGSLLVVVVAYVVGQIATTIFILFIDERRQFSFIGNSRPHISVRWAIGQFVGAFPFSVMNFAEVGLAYLSVLLVGVFVPDRIAIAQWGLTRTIANLLRGLSYQMTLPLAAELGHDHAIGDRDSLQRLYVRGSVVLVVVVSTVTSGVLAFWRDFFAIWTQGAIPYDAALSITLMLGTCLASPAILALSFANYSNRGPLLLRAKSMQLALFLVLSITLIPLFGPLGAAAALVASDLVAQSGFLSIVVVSEVLQRPIRYGLVLLGLMMTILAVGTALGETMRSLAPGSGIVHFVVECGLWLATVVFLASPLFYRKFRERLMSLLVLV